MRRLVVRFFVAVALVTASPTHQVPRLPRGISSKSYTVANGVYDTGDIIRRQEQSAGGAEDIDPLRSFSAAQQAAAEQAVRNFEIPFGNAAIWKEAIDIDKRNGNGHDNRNFYQTMAYLQEAENNSQTLISPYQTDGGSASPQDQFNVAPTISKALQFFQFYPAQLKQSQASDPANTLGKFSSQQPS